MSVYGSFADPGFALLTNIDDITTLWADVDGTIPASLNNRVKRIDDVSGNGRYLRVSSTSETGWLLKADENDRLYLERATGTEGRFIVGGDPLLTGLRSFLVAYFVYAGQDSAPYMPFVGDSTNYPFHGAEGSAIINATYAAASVSGGAWHKNGSAINPADTGTQPRDVPSSVTCVTTSSLSMQLRYWQDRTFNRNLVGRMYDVAVSTSAWSAGDIAAIHAVALTNYVDTSVYVTTPDGTTKNEGDTVTYSLANFESDGTYYYKITGTVDYNDFSEIGGTTAPLLSNPAGVVITGAVTVSAGAGSFTVVIREDVLIEGDETLIVEIYSDEALTNLVSTADTVTITDTSSGYTLVPDATAIDVGTDITYTITTTGLADYTKLTVTLMEASTVTPAEMGAGTSAGVIAGQAIGWFGTVVVVSNTATLVVSTDNVIAPAGASVVAGLYTEPPAQGGTLVALAEPVIIGADPLASVNLFIQPDVTVAAPDDDVIFTVTATGVDGTYTVYWDTSGSVIASDFDDTAISGSFTITIAGGTGTTTLTRAISATAADAGAELFAVQLRSNSGTGKIKVTSSTVLIKTADVAGYSISPDVTTLLEGQTVILSGTAIGEVDAATLYFSVDGGFVTAADFEPSGLTGSTTVTSEAFSFALEIAADDAVETNEPFVVTLRSGSPSGAVLATSTMIVIQEGGIVIYNDKTNLTENNDTLTATIKATNVADGTQYWWEILGSATADDFTTAVSGTVTITSGTATITLTTYPDALTEVGGESFIILLRAGSSTGNVVATSPLVIIGDTSMPAPTYAITANGASVNEDQGAQFTVLITGYPNASTFYYSTTGSVSAADFDDQSLTGTFQVFGDELAAIGTITRTIAVDRTTEGNETFQIQIRLGSVTGPVVGTSQTVTIVDTSIGDPAYSASASALNLYEGASTTITVTANNVGNKSLYWDAYSAALTADEFDPATLDGTVNVTGTIAESEGAFTLTTSTTDAAIESPVSFYVRIREEQDGPIVASVGPITILHPSYSLAVSTTDLAEGGSLTATIATTNVPNGTQLHWLLSGTVSGTDFAGGVVTGTVTINSNTGQFTLDAVVDYLSEDDESFVIEIHTGSAAGPLVALSDTITLVDADYSLAVDINSITEGETATFTATIENAPDGTYYWTLASDSTATAADFNDAADSGSFTITGGTGTITRTALADITADGAEFFWLELRQGSIAGTVLAVSPTVLIVDPAPAVEPWLDVDVGRVVLVEMEHSEGTVYIGSVPFISSPSDTDPNRSYDDVLLSDIEYESRIDTHFDLGNIAAMLDDTTAAWTGYKWRGFPIRVYLGELGDARDDFIPAAYVINGGLISWGNGRLEWGIYDGMAVFDSPLQGTFLDNGDPVPLAFGMPFNIAPAVIDVGQNKYQVHGGAILSVTPRDNGAPVLSGDNRANGIIELSIPAQGTVTADVVTPLSLPAAIIAWACAQKSVPVVGDTLAPLPAYPLGLYYDSNATLADVLADVCASIHGYWRRDALGRVRIVEKSAPAVTADIVLTVDDIVADSMDLVSINEPAASVTVNYRRNFAPIDRNALAGVVAESPAQADLLSQQWSSVTVENDVSDYPLAQAITVDTYVVDEANATALANKIADLRAVRRYQWRLQVFLSAGDFRPGKTVRITHRELMFAEGANAVIISVSPQFVGGIADIEVWL